MVQYVIIGILVLISLSYLVRILLRSFKGQATCETGCGKCNVEQPVRPLAQKN